MQENKFENQVQKTMDEFRIRPSEAVWEKVEEELQKKKKRRVVFYLFVLAGLCLLGYSGYFVYNSSTSKLVPQTITASQDKDNLINENELLPSIGNSASDSQQSENENQQSIAEKRKSQPSRKINKFSTDEKTNSLLPDNENQAAIEEKSNSAAATDIILKENKILSSEKYVTPKPKSGPDKIKGNKSRPDQTSIESNAVVNNKSVQTGEKTSSKDADEEATVITKQTITHPGIVETKLNTGKELPHLYESIQLKNNNIPQAVVIADKEIPAKKIRIKPVPKIKWGIDLSVGISSFKENIFSIYDGQKSIFMDNNPSPVSGGSNNAQSSIRSPSSIQSNPAFRVGVAGEMKLSRISSISSGLRYAYFSNRIKVGTYTDTVIALSNTFSQASRADAIYRGTYNQEYNNRFHFIQLPVQYQLQLNKGIKVPISWNAGVSVGYLFSTNSLVYDTAAGGIYFRTKDAFNKVQVNFNTGFSFRFGNKSKLQWSLGPELSLGLNKLMKTEFTTKQYLLYSGITGRIMFTKKNNK
ncbi:MAG: outer membrane beta-barrel protein [Chitinophagaceae bacterium]